MLQKPLNETELTGEDAEKMQKLLDVLENLDDVQDVIRRQCSTKPETRAFAIGGINPASS